MHAYNELTFCHEVRLVTLSITNQGGSPPVSWDWNYVGGTPGTGFRQDSVLGPLQYNDSGTYWVYVETSFANGSSQLDTWKLNAFVSIVPDFSFPDSVVCGTSSTLNLNYGSGISGPIYRYLWEPGQQTTESITINSAGAYTGVVYSVDDFSDRFGACDSQWRDFNITREDPISVNLPQNLFICEGAPVTLDAENPGATYTWQPNGENTRTIEVSIPGVYSVRVISPLGCTAEGRTTVKDSCPIYVWMPNAFTLNNDGRNDSLRWQGNLYSAKNYSFMIFNRWGEKLFETNDMWQSWDGYYSGEPVPAGVYVYQVYFIDSKDEVRFLAGDVTILR